MDLPRDLWFAKHTSSPSLGLHINKLPAVSVPYQSSLVSFESLSNGEAIDSDPGGVPFNVAAAVRPSIKEAAADV